MFPPQTIDVAGQAFTPDGFHTTWHQPIEPTARWGIECLKLAVLPQIFRRRSHFNRCISCLVHPTFCSLSAEEFAAPSSRSVSMGSRPRARAPTLRFFPVDGACLFCPGVSCGGVEA